VFPNFSRLCDTLARNLIILSDFINQKNVESVLSFLSLPLSYHGNLCTGGS
jgi:hypothetical protein